MRRRGVRRENVRANTGRRLYAFNWLQQVALPELAAGETASKDWTGIYTTPVKDQFVQDLFSILPPALAADAKIQFCGPTGTDAVEAALKLVRTATGRSTVLSFQGGYHGMSQGALSLMGSLGPKRPLGALLSSGVQFMPYPYDYRCPFGLGG